MTATASSVRRVRERKRAVMSLNPSRSWAQNGPATTVGARRRYRLTQAQGSFDHLCQLQAGLLQVLPTVQAPTDPLLPAWTAWAVIVTVALPPL